jgi:hypothetical protein
MSSDKLFALLAPFQAANFGTEILVLLVSIFLKTDPTPMIFELQVLRFDV